MTSDEDERRIALLVEYEGTAYSGSQYQKNAGTIQDSLERALSSLTGELIRLALAGRTDAGVHARGQVASFLTHSRHSPETFRRGLNALLRRDVSVRAAADVPTAFDPRRDATGRWYRYTIDTAAARPALARRFVWHVGRSLDLQAMTAAAALLVGRHDFATFTQPSEAIRRQTERAVCRSIVGRSRNLVLFDIEAGSFLPRMVRRLTGALVEVGLGKRDAAEIKDLLLTAAPGAASFTAPAGGLCLMKVRYESELFEDETDEDI
jgi:tRNA pseudouridine38-40 synthase